MSKKRVRKQRAEPVVEKQLLPACRWAGRDKPRMIVGQHVEPVPPLAWCSADCRGCVECTETHCVVCSIVHLADLEDPPPMTCPECVGRVRSNLKRIMELCTMLRPQAINAASEGRLAAAAPIPGSTAMVLMGPNPDFDDWMEQRIATEWASQSSRTHHPDKVVIGIASARIRPRIAAHLDDDNVNDPEPPLMTLTAHAHNWRQILNQPTQLRATLIRAYDYLDDKLTWAAQKHPGFDNFAREISDCVARLEDALEDGDRADPAGVSCVECGGSLAQTADKPKHCHHRRGAEELAKHLAPEGSPTFIELLTLRLHKWLLSAFPDAAADHEKNCDQGGFHNVEWYCRKCGRKCNPSQYNLAVRAKIEDLVKAKTA